MLKRDFQLSEKKLRNFAKGQGTRIRVITGVQLKGCLAAFDSNINEIRIKKSLKKQRSYFLFVMAHEIGHSIDDNSNAYDKAYEQLLYSKCALSYKAKHNILKCERSANKHALKIIKDLKIPIKSEYLKQFSNDCIRSYRNLFKNRI